MRQHKDLPISPLLQTVNSLAKGVAVIGYSSVLQACNLADMRKAVAALTEQRSCKRMYIWTEETLTVGDVQDLIAKKDGGSKEIAKQPAKRVRKERHSRRCSKTRHNTRTCTAVIVDLEESDASK